MVNQGNIQADVDPNQVAHAVSQAPEAGKEILSEAAEKAREAGDKATEKTKQGMNVVGDKMTSLAGTLRGAAPSEGKIGSSVGSAVNKVADSLESSGQYLKERDLGDIADDVGGVIKKYPIQSLWIGIGVGVLLGAAIFRKD